MPSLPFQGKNPERTGRLYDLFVQNFLAFELASMQADFMS